MVFNDLGAVGLPYPDPPKCSDNYTPKPRYKVRKHLKSIFGCIKPVVGFRRSGYREVERTGLCGELVATAYKLVRMSRMIAE